MGQTPRTTLWLGGRLASRWQERLRGRAKGLYGKTLGWVVGLGRTTGARTLRLRPAPVPGSSRPAPCVLPASRTSCIRARRRGWKVGAPLRGWGVLQSAWPAIRETGLLGPGWAATARLGGGRPALLAPPPRLPELCLYLPIPDQPTRHPWSSPLPTPLLSPFFPPLPPPLGGGASPLPTRQTML